ncbi:MAG: hypothetical protein Q8Q12_09575 [bacterium]|nr:hypothetical protein [bacterium]
MPARARQKGHGAAPGDTHIPVACSVISAVRCLRLRTDEKNPKGLFLARDCVEPLLPLQARQLFDAPAPS